MIEIRLLEHTDILPGIRKRAGSTVIGLPKDRVIQLISEGKAEPVDFKGLPDGYPKREALVAHEIFSVDQVEATRDETLLSIEGIGPKTLKEIRNFNNTDNKEE